MTQNQKIFAGITYIFAMTLILYVAFVLPSFNVKLMTFGGLVILIPWVMTIRDAIKTNKGVVWIISLFLWGGVAIPIYLLKLDTVEN